MTIGWNASGQTDFDYKKGHQDWGTGPWKNQAPYLIRGFERAGQLLDQPAMNPLQQEALAGYTSLGRNFNPGYYDDVSAHGLNSADISLAGARMNLGMGSRGLRFLTSPGMLSPDRNPYLSQYADAIARPVMQNLTERILPSIRSDAINAGQYGGTRQGVAEGIASRGASQAIADSTAGLYSNAYGQGLNALTSGVNAAPNYAGAGSGVSDRYLNMWGNAPTVGQNSFNLQRMPSDVLNQAGTQEQQAPWQQLAQFMQMIQGNYGSEGRTNSYSQDFHQMFKGGFGAGAN